MNKKHGGYGTRTYKTWAEMLYRCRKKGKIYYHDKGITVCKRWNKFENFLTDMGYRPIGMTLDRINNNGNYTKNNCRWATNREQAINRSSTKLVSFKGKSMTLKDWSVLLKIKRSTLAQRLYTYKWSIEKTLTKGVDFGTT